jgi:RNA polymerase sigma factor (sigma-70 family)
MVAEPLRILLRRLRRAADPTGDAALSDAQLIERFVARRDEAAFELLVWRHGTMVLNLCRRLLRQEQDAEDAFQATFLVLARKARSIGKRESCASWLYKVAFRVALAARTVLAVRAARERPCPDELPAVEAPDDLAWRDLRPVLDEEVRRLPEKYRAAFVLCCLQGRSNAEAAQELGCPPGTVLSRLSRARERLRQRLLRRGVCLSAGLVAAVVSANAQAAPVTADLVTTTSKAALGFAAGQAAAAVASARAAALTEGVIRAMFLSKLKLALGAVVVALGLAGLGVGFVGDQLVAAPPPSQEKPKPPPATEPPPPVAEKRDESDDPTKAVLQRLESRRKLKKIGTALQNFNDTYGKRPAPAIYSKDDKPLLSWRVAILPFIEQDALYKAFHLDEPWDSEHNTKLLAQMPAFYAPPGQKDGGKTYYQAIVGEGAAWEPRKQLPPVEFPDGTSNTICVVEAATPVPWTKPEDLPFVPDQALPKFGGLFDGNFHALLVDGGVLFLSARADEEHLRRAITRADGNPIDFNKIVAEGRAPGGKVDLDDLPRQNQRLKEAVEAALKEVAREKDNMGLLKAKIAAGTPQVDAKTARLLKEHEELQKTLDKALEELEKLRAERERLEVQLPKAGGEKTKPQK